MAFEDLVASSTCDVCIKGPGQDASGAPLRDPYTVVVAAVPVLIRPTGGSLEQRNEKRTQVRLATLYIDPIDLPAGFVLKATHQLRVPNVASNRIFVIQSVSDPNTMGHHLEVECEQQPA